MTVQTPTRPAAPPPRPPAPALAERGSRLERWLAGWRLALRLGRRDAVRHKGRSALVVLMVALPVMLLVGGNILAAIASLSPVERLPFTMGQAQARISYQGDEKLVVLPTSDSFFGGDTTHERATPIPGWGESQPQRRAALAQLTGGTVAPVQSFPGLVTVGRKTYDVQVLGADPTAYPFLEGIVHLRSGRWAATPTEVVVTPSAIARGIPSEGTVVAVDPNTGVSVTMTIVGVAEAYSTMFGHTSPVDAVITPLDVGGMGETSYVIDRATPVTWAEVERWAAYGLLTTSRAVTLDPPPADQVHAPAELQQRADDEAVTQLLLTAVAAVGLLVETTLLVGPAFAVSAARSRRTLALAASNGAPTGQLRRTVLGQALVLGVLSVAVGGLLGVIGAYAVVAWSRTNRPDAFFGPWDVPFWPVLLVLAVAVLATVIAALIPARGLARLDIVGVLRGQSVSPRARARVPVVGLVLFVVGSALLLGLSALPPTADIPVVLPLLMAIGGFVLLVVGALMLVPMSLVLGARLGRAAPAAARMALRDAARQRGRATSTVAAILAGCSIATIVLVASASGTEFGQRIYQPQVPIGAAMASPRSHLPNDEASAWQRLRATISATTPTLRQVEVQRVGGTGKGPEAIVSAVRTGCTPEETLGLLTSPTPAVFSRCVTVDSMGMGGMSILIAPVEDLITMLGLDATQAAMLRAGGVLVDGRPPRNQGMIGFGPDPTDAVPLTCCVVDIVDGKMTLTWSEVSLPTGDSVDERPKPVAAPQTARVPALAMTDRLPTLAGNTGMIVSTETARSFGWTLAIQQLLLVDPSGTIPDDDEQRLRDAVTDSGVGFVYVERGFQPFDRWVTIVVLSLLGLIILAATLLATALSTAEMQPLMGTFAAVGATRGTRRRLAATQAASLGIIGGLLGVLVGLVPGITIARLATGATWGPGNTDPVGPIVVIPWGQLAIPVLVIPVLAAGLAWLAIRRDPQVTRRIS